MHINQLFKMQGSSKHQNLFLKATSLFPEH